jgi:hypothetical protein
LGLVAGELVASLAVLTVRLATSLAALTVGLTTSWVALTVGVEKDFLATPAASQVVLLGAPLPPMGSHRLATPLTRNPASDFRYVADHHPLDWTQEVWTYRYYLFESGQMVRTYR